MLAIKQNKFLYIFTVLWLSLMMFLSHQPGPDTAKTSGVLAKIITEFVTHTLGISVTVSMVHEFIRHAAHVILYMVLAVDLGLLLRRARMEWFWIVFLLMCIALADEGTKPLIAGRHCELIDIGRNCIGNIIGLGMVFLYKMYKK